MCYQTLSNNEITSSNDPIQSFFFHLALSQPLFPVCDKSLLSVANYLKCLNIQGAEKKSNWKKKKTLATFNSIKCTILTICMAYDLIQHTWPIKINAKGDFS